MRVITIQMVQQMKEEINELFNQLIEAANKVQECINTIDDIRRKHQHQNEISKEDAEEMAQAFLLLQEAYANITYQIDIISQVVEHYYREFATIYQQLGVQRIKNGYIIRIQTNEIFIEKKDEQGNYSFFLRLFPARSVIRDIFDVIFP